LDQRLLGVKEQWVLLEKGPLEVNFNQEVSPPGSPPFFYMLHGYTRLYAG
jgi:hypothetical protein